MCCVSYVNIQNCQSFHLSFSYSKCMYLLFSFHFHWFFMSLNFYFFLSPNFLLLLWNLQYTFFCVGISSKKKHAFFGLTTNLFQILIDRIFVTIRNLFCFLFSFISIYFNTKFVYHCVCLTNSNIYLRISVFICSKRNVEKKIKTQIKPIIQWLKRMNK